MVTDAWRSEATDMRVDHIRSNHYFWHSKGKRFTTGDEKQELTMLVKRSYSTIDLKAMPVDRGSEPQACARLCQQTKA